MIAASLGNVITAEAKQRDFSDVKFSGPTIAEMAAIAQPIGGDTMGASVRIIEHFAKMQGAT